MGCPVARHHREQEPGEDYLKSGDGECCRCQKLAKLIQGAKIGCNPICGDHERPDKPGQDQGKSADDPTLKPGMSQQRQRPFGRYSVSLLIAVNHCDNTHDGRLYRDGDGSAGHNRPVIAKP